MPFSCRAAPGRTVGEITLCRVDGDELEGAELLSGRNESADALGAPVWVRFGHFAVRPSGGARHCSWVLANRSVVIAGGRGGEPFEDLVA